MRVWVKKRQKNSEIKKKIYSKNIKDWQGKNKVLVEKIFVKSSQNRLKFYQKRLVFW